MYGDYQAVLGVFNRYNDKPARGNAFSRAKSHRTLFYINKEGKLSTRKVNRWQAFYWNRFKSFRRVLVCRHCEKKMYGYSRRKSQVKAYICYECSNN